MLRCFQGLMPHWCAMPLLSVAVGLVGARSATAETVSCPDALACEKMAAFEKALPAKLSPKLERASARLKKSESRTSADHPGPSDEATKPDKGGQGSSSAKAGALTIEQLETLRSLSTDAAKAYLGLEHVCQDKHCDPRPFRARLGRTLAKYVRFLVEMRDRETDKAKGAEIEEELWRVVSGSAGDLAITDLIWRCQQTKDCPLDKIGELVEKIAEVAARNHQPPSTLIDGVRSYLNAGGDPSQLGPVLVHVSDQMDKNPSSEANLGEVLGLYGALGNKERRRRVIQLLHQLDASLSTNERRILAKLEQDGGDARGGDLMDLLVKARRSLVVQSLGVASELGYQPGRSEASKPFLLQFYSSSGEGPLKATIDFQENTLSLLTAAISEGLKRLENRADVEPARHWACGDQKAKWAGALLRIGLEDSPVGRIRATTQVYMKDTEICEGRKQDFDRIVVEVPALCSDGSQNGCIGDQLRAAEELVGALAAKYSMFSQLRQLRRAISVEQMGPPLHPGVRITDRAQLAAVDAPALLADAPGLRVTGSCGDDFGKRLRHRMTISYPAEVGSLVEKGDVPELRLESRKVGECEVKLLLGTQQVYGVQAASENMGDAGDDVGRVIGQYYRDVRMALSRRPAPPPVLASRWGALLFSGLPYLSDQRRENDKVGWTLTGIDVTLTACTVVGVGLSVRERNTYAGNPGGSLRSADTALWTGIGCLIVLGVERALATGLYR